MFKKRAVKQEKHFSSRNWDIKIFFLTLITLVSISINLIYPRDLLKGKFRHNNLTHNITFVKKKPNEKIIAIIFYGRKILVEILMKYLVFLMGKGKLDEIHFWYFTNRFYSLGYINSITNLHKTSKAFTDYTEIYPKITDNKVELSLKGDGNAFILINDKIEIIIDADEGIKRNLTSKFAGDKLIFIDNIVEKKRYVNISLKFMKNKDLIITSKNKILRKINTNEKYFKSIKIHSGYGKEMFWDYTEISNIGIKSFDSEHRTIYHWYDSYKYYLDYEYDILLKIDDDIVFIDVNRYDNYIKYIRDNPDKNVIYANTINQCPSLFYNNKYGLIPDKFLLDKYKNKTDVNNYFVCVFDAQMASNMHNHFFNNTKKYLNYSYKPILFDNHRVNINFFGINKKNYFKSFREEALISSGYNPQNFPGDEPYVYKLKNNYLFPNFVVSHYSFRYQVGNGFDKDQKILDRYIELSKTIL